MHLEETKGFITPPSSPPPPLDTVSTTEKKKLNRKKKHQLPKASQPNALGHIHDCLSCRNFFYSEGKRAPFNTQALFVIQLDFFSFKQSLLHTWEKKGFGTHISSRFKCSTQADQAHCTLLANRPNLLQTLHSLRSL